MMEWPPEEMRKRAAQVGMESCRNGRSFEDNPYAGKELRAEWEAGFIQQALDEAAEFMVLWRRPAFRQSMLERGMLP